MIKQRQIYLSGAMEYAPELGAGWRKEITPKLEALGYTVLDPCVIEDLKLGGYTVEQYSALKKSNLQEYCAITRSGIITTDVRAVAESDILLVYYTEACQKGAGTASECMLAYFLGKPIILVTSMAVTDLSGWLLSEATVITPNFLGALKILEDKPYVDSMITYADDIRENLL